MELATLLPRLEALVSEEAFESARAKLAFHLIGSDYAAGILGPKLFEAVLRQSPYNAAASLVDQPTVPFAQPHYVTCLDLGAWGAVYCEGWDRTVVLTRDEAKAMKRQINGEWIYPPQSGRLEDILEEGVVAATVSWFGQLTRSGERRWGSGAAVARA